MGMSKLQNLLRYTTVTPSAKVTMMLYKMR